MGPRPSTNPPARESGGQGGSRVSHRCPCHEKSVAFGSSREGLWQSRRGSRAGNTTNIRNRACDDPRGPRDPPPGGRVVDSASAPFRQGTGGPISPRSSRRGVKREDSSIGGVDGSTRTGNARDGCDEWNSRERCEPRRPGGPCGGRQQSSWRAPSCPLVSGRVRQGRADEDAQEERRSPPKWWGAAVSERGARPDAASRGACAAHPRGEQSNRPIEAPDGVEIGCIGRGASERGHRDPKRTRARSSPPIPPHPETSLIDRGRIARHPCSISRLRHLNMAETPGVGAGEARGGGALPPPQGPACRG